MNKKKSSTYKLDEELMQKFELLSIYLEKDRQEIIRELISDFVEKYEIEFKIKKKRV